MEYLYFLVAIVALFIILKLIALPLKLIIKLMANAVIGGIVLFLINTFGVQFGLFLDINWISALIVGFLGIPGVIIVLIFSFLV